MRSKDTTWRVSDEFLDTPAAEVFVDLDAVFACTGKMVSADRISQVKRVVVAGRGYYVKTYTAAGKRLRRLVGRSRIRAEWENLVFLSRLGIATAKVVAYGEERKRGRSFRGALVTEEVENSADLNAHIETHPELARDRGWMDAVIDQVAHYTRAMHRAGFAHNDLNWRNILVTRDRQPKVYFIDCPSGRVWPKPLLQRRIVKDLAHLDKVGRERLSRSSLLRFYLRYRGTKRLTAADKRTIAHVRDFHSEYRKRKQRGLQSFERGMELKAARRRQN